MADPRGGVRHVIPWKGNYPRAPTRPLATGTAARPVSAPHPAALRARDRHRHHRRLRPGQRPRADPRARVRGPAPRGTGPAGHGRLPQHHPGDGAAPPPRLDGGMGSARGGREAQAGRFEARVVEVAAAGTIASFHPKSWRFEGDGFGVAFVGSSNVSRTALGDGVEWNLRVERAVDPAAYRLVVRGVRGLVGRARRARRRRGWRPTRRAPAARRVALPPGEAETRAAPGPAGAASPAARGARRPERGAGSGPAAGRLVVLATGLGKTWLAAFDVDAVRAEDGPDAARPVPRAPLGAARPGGGDVPPACSARRRFSLVRGRARRLDAATWSSRSVQKLSRPAGLARLAADSARHSTTSSSTRSITRRRRATAAILDAARPGFVLGLTATPDRADEADVVGLFDDNLRVPRGPGRRHRARACSRPFAYFGAAGRRRLREHPLAQPALRPRRARAGSADRRRAWSGCGRRGRSTPARRTLVFCCSIAHAEFVRDVARRARRARGGRALGARVGATARRPSRALAGGRARRALQRRPVQRGRSTCPTSIAW